VWFIYISYGRERLADALFYTQKMTGKARSGVCHGNQRIKHNAALVYDSDTEVSFIGMILPCYKCEQTKIIRKT